ncbi:MAG: hypothetical protein AAGA54_28670 [Myxococcota bacterium]
MRRRVASFAVSLLSIGACARRTQIEKAPGTNEPKHAGHCPVSTT